MPPLDVGVLLYMPTTVPGISITEAERLLQLQDRVLVRFPEVDQGTRQGWARGDFHRPPRRFPWRKTVITLKPVSEWRKVDTWYSAWAPDWIKPLFRHFTPDHISQDDLVDQMNQAVSLPGVSNAWTMPIKNRVDHAHHRHPVHRWGVKVFGPGHQHHRTDRAPHRNPARARGGNAQRVRRAHRRRLFPGRGVGPGKAGPLRF